MCGEECYELSPADGWVGGLALSEDEAVNWIVRLAANVDTLCYDTVGVWSVNLKGVEWLNGVGRAARDVCVVLGM